MKKNQLSPKKLTNALYLKYVPVIILAIIANVSMVNAEENDEGTIRISSFPIIIGPNWGGILDDSQVDAVTTATRMKYNAGMHTEIGIKGHIIETGIDYQVHDQTFTYLDPSQQINGTRDFSLQQVILPLTYNFHLFKNKQKNPLMIIKLGLSVGYIFSTVTDSGSVPVYDLYDWGFGPVLGLSAYPINISNSYSVGLYCDLCRGFKVYDDVYNTDMGNLFYAKFGLAFRLHDL